MSHTLHFLPKNPRLGGPDHHPERIRAALAGTIEPARRRGLRAGAERFVAPDRLVAAINAALATRSPLLLTGDPGTGKTETAYFLARWLGIGDPVGQPLHFQVRSDSSANDLRYDFDAVAYLQDAYAQQIPEVGPGEDPRLHPRYLRPGPLWLAYESKQECVLLIDEIDKAPRDFPNDLLQEFSEQAFAKPFAHGMVSNQGPPPILIITSNGERRLPDPFLRRCVVCHLELEEALLERILDAWESAFAGPPDSPSDFPPESAPEAPPGSPSVAPGGSAPAALLPGVRPVARQAFDALRLALKQGRPPGIAELLMWLNALAVLRIPAARIDPKDLPGLPCIHCLVKEQEDYRLLGRAHATPARL